MGRMIIVIALLAACTSDPKPTAPPAPAELVRAPLLPTAPAEAEDLDPDPDVLHVKLVASTREHTIDGETVAGYAYNDQLPGPTLRAKVGDTVKIELQNDLDDATTIHWHGLHVPYAMDGVTWQTEPVASGGTFTYEFKLNQTGTYWYHPHFNTARQVDLGLYGALIVEDPADPEPDEELVLIFDAVNEFIGKSHDELDEEDEHDHSHGPESLIGRWLVNGVYQPTIELTGGTWVRVRMVNTSNAGYLDLRMPGIKQIASDQGLLPKLDTPDSLVLAPSDRADVMFLVGDKGFDVTTAPYTLRGGPALTPSAAKWSTPQTLFTVTVKDPAPAPAAPAFAWSGAAPSPDPTYTDILYVFSGSDEGGEWLMNGETFPNVTVEEVALNSEVIIEVRNLSPSEHPFHLHGHGFEVLSIDGVAPAYRTFEDTVNVGIRQRLRLKLTANNPGFWMTHCHILPHAGHGMMTVLRVLDE